MASAALARGDGVGGAPGGVPAHLATGKPADSAHPCESDAGVTQDDDGSNAGSLCAHLGSLGLSLGAYSDCTVLAYGRSWPLHRVVLARSPYFRRLFEGSWRDSGDATLSLTLTDDANATAEGLHATLSWLYGQPLVLESATACGVLACAAFLNLDALCDTCVAFVVGDLRDDSFLRYFAFAESANYGPLGDRVRAACWGYLCRCASRELRHTLPSLPLATLVSLFTSAELFASTEVERFQLACDTFTRRWSAVSKLWARPGACHEDGADAAVEAVFGQGGIVYATFSFPALTAARAALSAAGAPVSILAAVSDGLWQQTVLRQHVLAAAASASRGVTPGDGAESADSCGGTGGCGDGSQVTLRFGTEFTDDLAGLDDGQARHGSEVFFAGSYWKVSAQVFFASSPPAGAGTPHLDGGAWTQQAVQSRGTGAARAQLGLFLHRRRADDVHTSGATSWLDDGSTGGGGSHMYCDTRERVCARYQIILGTPHSLLVLGTLAPDNPSIVLPKAPKGWGWRSVGALGEVARHPLRVSVAVQLHLPGDDTDGVA